MTSPLFDQTITGIVTHANEKGIRLSTSDGWLNVSKFAVGVVLPERGQAVAVTLDKGGFIRAVTLADAPIAGASDARPSVTPSDKERTITRLAVLKAAAEFGAARPSVKSADVLLIAESWERWVLRDGAADDLSDAL